MKKIQESKQPSAIVATTPDDSHAWNLIGIGLRLEERGYKVENLGPCTPETLLAETVRALRPDLVVLSSINGHGALSLFSVLETLEQYQAKRTAPIVVGGLLTTDPAEANTAAAQLFEEGVDGVFIGTDAWERFDTYLTHCRNTANEFDPNYRKDFAMNNAAIAHDNRQTESASKNDNPDVPQPHDAVSPDAKPDCPAIRWMKREFDDIPDWVLGGG